jgi:nuclear pore complex protein Nup107
VHRIAGALFLNSFVLSADPIEGRTTLQHAREHVLNVSHMAVITAEHTIKSVPDDLPSSVEGPLPDLSKHAEILLVRSIEWTVIGLDTYDMALEQVSVILRYLLGARLLLFFFWWHL